MNDEPDNRELEKRIELLQKDFEVMQANVDATLHEMRAESHQMRAESAKRETRMLLAIAGMLGLAVAIIGFLI